MISIEKELLNARLHYLEELSEKSSDQSFNPMVTDKVKQLIKEGEITNYMALESVYSYLEEKLKEDSEQVDEYADEIISFLA